MKAYKTLNTCIRNHVISLINYKLLFPLKNQQITLYTKIYIIEIILMNSKRFLFKPCACKTVLIFQSRERSNPRTKHAALYKVRSIFIHFSVRKLASLRLILIPPPETHQKNLSLSLFYCRLVFRRNLPKCRSNILSLRPRD